MNGKTIYRAPWGMGVKVISGLLVLLTVGLPLVVPAGEDLVTSVLALVLVGSLPFMVRGYEITDDAILVRRLLWKTGLKRADLISAEVSPRVMRGCLRTCGNGGVFSYTGWFWSRSLGGFHAYVTAHDRTVVLRFDGRTVVVSPDRPEDFVRELERLKTASEDLHDGMNAS